MVARYGFIQREIEDDFMDKIILVLNSDFGEVRFLEIGVFGGGTVSGVVRKCHELNIPIYPAGVDFAEQKPNPPPNHNYEFYEGDSMDAWRHIQNRFNFLMVDGCHCVNHSMCDFLNYSPFVVVGGYCLFHDTALPLHQYEQQHWPQDHSYAGKDPSRLGVREGLKKVGLLQGHRTDWKLVEEITSDSGLMGMMLFQKMEEL